MRLAFKIFDIFIHPYQLMNGTRVELGVSNDLCPIGIRNAILIFLLFASVVQ